MAAWRSCSLDYLPENVLIEIFSYLNVRELLGAGRVCKRWRRLVKDQKLWRNVDLSQWKKVTSRMLWALLRQYLGSGLRSLKLRGLLLSHSLASFLSESWLQALWARCGRLRHLTLLQVDLRRLRGSLLLSPNLRVLELRSCEVPSEFFCQRTEKDAPAVAIETLVVEKVPSFTDAHLISLGAWQQLSRLELRDLIRVTSLGVSNCAALARGDDGVTGFTKLRALELSSWGRPNTQGEAASGLKKGWVGLQELTLGGSQMDSGMMYIKQLSELQRLRLRNCALNECSIVSSLHGMTSLRRLEIWEVILLNDFDMGEDPMVILRQMLADYLPACTVEFTRCNKAGYQNRPQ